MNKNKLEHRPKSPKPKRRIPYGKILYLAFFVTVLGEAFTTPAYATTVWDKAGEIMKDVYTQILAISTIAGIVTAAIALLLMNFSKNGRTVDESRAWLK